ncbi:MAG: hypothetical protein QM804_06520 [Propionicimonas sp.]
MRKLVLPLLLVLSLTGCTTPLGRHLGTVHDYYPIRLDNYPPTRIWADDLAELQQIMVDLDAVRLGKELAAIDLASEIVVSVGYDGCGHSDPGLVLEGATLRVRFGTVHNRQCVRPMPSLALFAVPRAELPDLATVELQVTD